MQDDLPFPYNILIPVFPILMLCQVAAAGSMLFSLMGGWFFAFVVVFLLLSPFLMILLRSLAFLLIPAMAILAYMGVTKVWGWPILFGIVIAVPSNLAPSWYGCPSGRLSGQAGCAEP